MNQLFVARYTSSRNGVEADVIILLQAIEGDLGVLVHRIILVVSVRLSPKHKPKSFQNGKTLENRTVGSKVKDF